jgi:putative oxidoreductase
VNCAKVYWGARLLLGLIFLVFGLNGFLQFLPIPPMPDAAMSFLGALGSSGYFFPVLKATEVLCGLLLLTGFAAPVALVILAPITLQIFLFHAVLTPGLQNLILPIAMVVLHILAACAFWPKYAPLFKKA